MIFFEADARDNFPNGSNDCNSCCSEYASAVPGETNKWRISYAKWLAPIRGRGLVAPIVFSWQKMTPNPPAPFPLVLPPTNTDYSAQIGANTAYSGTVATNGVSPQSTALTFALDPVNPPSNGVLAMNTNGTFIYVPDAGYTGVDTFGFTTSDGVNAPIENIFTLGVDTIIASHFVDTLPPGVINLTGGESALQVYETPLPPNQGSIYVDPTKVHIRGWHVEFVVTVSPETLIGQIYRMTIAAQAMECEGSFLRHISSYDILTTKCGVLPQYGGF
jgi:hypothetical protein